MRAMCERDTELAELVVCFIFPTETTVLCGDEWFNMMSFEASEVIDFSRDMNDIELNTCNT